MPKKRARGRLMGELAGRSLRLPVYIALSNADLSANK